MVGYVETNLSIKHNHKYKTVTMSIRLTKEYKKLYKSGSHNVVYEKKRRIYYFRMFDDKLMMKEINRIFSWQVVKLVLKNNVKQPDHINIKEAIKIH
jgi:hypothetical protein